VFRRSLAAAEIILPAEKVKLKLAFDKKTLTTEFGVPFLWTMQATFKPFLRQHGWSGAPVNAEEERIYRDLKPLADKVEQEGKRAEQAAADLSRIRLINKIVDQDPENFYSKPTTEGSTVELEKQVKEKSVIITNLKNQLAAIMKVQPGPEQIKEVTRILKIEDRIMDKTEDSLNKARLDEALLISAGVDDKHPKVKALRALISEYSRQIAEFLSSVQQNRATLLEIEQGRLAELKVKLNEATANPMDDKNKLTSYYEAKSRYLMAKKVFEAAQQKYSSELFDRGIQ
jgi:hypothetical protein